MKLIILILLLTFNNIGYCHKSINDSFDRYNISRYDEYLDNDDVLLFFGGYYILGFSRDGDPNENNFFNGSGYLSDNEVILVTHNTIEIDIITNIKMIKSIEFIDYNSKHDLCYQKPKIEFPELIAKYNFNPHKNINYLGFRIKQPCINKYVKDENTSRLIITVTTKENKIFILDYQIRVYYSAHVFNPRFLK